MGRRAGPEGGAGRGWRRPLPALPPHLGQEGGLEAPPPPRGPAPARPHAPHSPRARGPSRGGRVRGSRPRRPVPPGRASPAPPRLWEAPLSWAPSPPTPAGPGTSALSFGGRADTPAGGGVYWTLSSLTGGGLAAGGHRVPAWGERGVRGGGRGAPRRKPLHRRFQPPPSRGPPGRGGGQGLTVLAALRPPPGP